MRDAAELTLGRFEAKLKNAVTYAPGDQPRRRREIAWKMRQLIWKVTAKGEDTFQILATRDSSGPTSARLMSTHLLVG